MNVFLYSRLTSLPGGGRPCTRELVRQHSPTGPSAALEINTRIQRPGRSVAMRSQRVAEEMDKVLCRPESTEWQRVFEAGDCGLLFCLPLRSSADWITTRHMRIQRILEHSDIASGPLSPGGNVRPEFWQIRAGFLKRGPAQETERQRYRHRLRMRVYPCVL